MECTTLLQLVHVAETKFTIENKEKFAFDLCTMKKENETTSSLSAGCMMLSFVVLPLGH